MALFVGVGFLTYGLTHSFLLLVIFLVCVLIAFAWYIGATNSIGIFLLLIPLQWLVIALLQFNGVAEYKLISALKELFLVGAILWALHRSSRLQLTLPDILLGAALLVVFFEQLFHTDMLGLRDDWEWVLPYALGRLLILTPAVQARWAKCAVWMCAVLAVIGIWEVQFLGSAPRLLLLNASQGDTRLPSAFLATGYAGFRAASTMVSPLSFSALCVVALVLWWTYMKNPIPALLIAAGLTMTLTRSAVAAAVVALLVLAVRRRERGRVALFSAVFVIGLLIAVSTLDLRQFVNATFSSGADLSTVGHKTSVVKGFNAMLENPLGIGAGTVGPHQAVTNGDVLQIESSYLVVAVEYGVLVGLLYSAFVASALWSIFQLREPVTYAAFSLLLGFALLLAVGPIHLDIPLACWVWCWVGMGVTCAADTASIPTLQVGPSR
jgi:hypothetical protein